MRSRTDVNAEETAPEDDGTDDDGIGIKGASSRLDAEPEVDGPEATELSETIELSVATEREPPAETAGPLLVRSDKASEPAGTSTNETGGGNWGMEARSDPTGARTG
jgi:hypothetical protein